MSVKCKLYTLKSKLHKLIFFSIECSLIAFATVVLKWKKICGFCIASLNLDTRDCEFKLRACTQNTMIGQPDEPFHNFGASKSVARRS